MKVKLSAIFATTMLFLSQSPQAVAQESKNIFRHPLSISTESNEAGLTLLPTGFLNSESGDSGNEEAVGEWELIEDYTSPEVLISATNHSNWTPHFDTVKPVYFNLPKVFDQNRNYTKKVEYFTQEQERNSVTGEVRRVGEEEYFEKTERTSESRTITATFESREIGERYNCTEYSPSEDTVVKGVEFEQERRCKQETAFFYVYTHIEDELYTKQPWRSNYFNLRERRMSIGTLEIDHEELNVVFDLGTFYLEDNVIEKTFAVSKPSFPSNYSSAVFEINYAHTFPEDVTYSIYNPNGELVLSLPETSSQTGDRHYTRPIQSLGGVLNGQWSVVVEDSYEGDGGYISAKITLPYSMD